MPSRMFKAGKLPEAIELYSAAVRLKPDFELAHYNLAVALHRQGQAVRAAEEFAQAQRLAAARNGSSPPP
jgi:tetratricopeptide (TPR) repeat protein